MTEGIPMRMVYGGQKIIRQKVTSLMLICLLILTPFLSGCSEEISVTVTPKEVKPGEEILIKIYTPENTKVRVSIINEKSKYAKIIYEGMTDPDGILELKIPISSSNLEKKLGRNVVVVEAPELDLRSSASFVILGTSVGTSISTPSTLARIPIEKGNWNPSPHKVTELQRGLTELAYLFIEAEIVTNSVVFVDNQKTTYNEFKRRLEMAIYLWDAVEKKAEEVRTMARELDSALDMAGDSPIESSVIHSKKIYGPISIYAANVRAQIAGETVDIAAYKRDKRIAEIVEKFTPKIGKSAAERRAYLMWLNEQIQDDMAYKARLYDCIYKVLLGLETAGKIAEGVLAIYGGYTGLLKAKTVGEQAFRLSTLILTKFGVVFSLTKQGVKISATGTAPDGAYEFFTPGDYLNEGLGILGLATDDLSDPNNIVYIAGKIGNLVSPFVSGEIEKIIQMDLEGDYELTLSLSEISEKSPLSSKSSIEDYESYLFLPGHYKLPSGERIEVKKTHPALEKSFRNYLPDNYIVITSEGDTAGGTIHLKEYTITVNVKPSKVHAGERVVISGKVSPPISTTIHITLKNENTSYQKLFEVPTKSDGSFEKTLEISEKNINEKLGVISVIVTAVDLGITDVTHFEIVPKPKTNPWEDKLRSAWNKAKNTAQDYEEYERYLYGYCRDVLDQALSEDKLLDALSSLIKLDGEAAKKGDKIAVSVFNELYFKYIQQIN